MHRVGFVTGCTDADYQPRAKLCFYAHRVARGRLSVADGSVWTEVNLSRGPLKPRRGPRAILTSDDSVLGRVPVLSNLLTISKKRQISYPTIRGFSLSLFVGKRLFFGTSIKQTEMFNARLPHAALSRVIYQTFYDCPLCTASGSSSRRSSRPRARASRDRLPSDRYQNSFCT